MPIKGQDCFQKIPLKIGGDLSSGIFSKLRRAETIRDAFSVTLSLVQSHTLTNGSYLKSLLKIRTTNTTENVKGQIHQFIYHLPGKSGKETNSVFWNCRNDSSSYVVIAKLQN